MTVPLFKKYFIFYEAQSDKLKCLTLRFLEFSKIQNGLLDIAVLVFEKCFNFYTIQSGNLENPTLGFFKTLITNLRSYFRNSI